MAKTPKTAAAPPFTPRPPFNPGKTATPAKLDAHGAPIVSTIDPTINHFNVRAEAGGHVLFDVGADIAHLSPEEAIAFASRLLIGAEVAGGRPSELARLILTYNAIRKAPPAPAAAVDEHAPSV